jgi:hypothetical protein
MKKNHITMQQLCFVARIKEAPKPRDAQADASIAGPGHDVHQEQVRHLKTQQNNLCQYEQRYTLSLDFT